MNSKIVKVANTENKAKIIRFFSLINGKRKYICFINYSGKNLNLSTIHLGYISKIGEKLIIFKIEADPEWLKIKAIMENLFTSGTSEEIVTYPVEDIERIDIVDYHTFDKNITNYSTFFDVKVPEEIDFNKALKIPVKKESIVVEQAIIATESTVPVGPTRKKGSRLVIILFIILFLLAIAVTIYYFKDDLFNANEPTKNNKSIIENTKYKDNELVCNLKYNDNESSSIITEKISYVFDDDKTSIISVKFENKIKFTDKDEYTTSKQNAQLGLAFATMFDIEMNIEPNDENLTYVVTMNINADKALASGFEMEQKGSYDIIRNQALLIGYTCNGTSQDFQEDFGNEEIKSTNNFVNIVNDGWRIVATADEIDENSTSMEFTINIRHLNDSARNLNATLTTYDKEKNPLSSTDIDKDIKGNSFLTLNIDTILDTEDITDDFDFNDIKYFSIKINK